MANKKLTFNNVEYEINMDKLSDAVAAIVGRIDTVKQVTIILERQGDYDAWRYNGEIVDGNFVYDCLTSGGTVLLNQRNHSKVYELVSWILEDGVLKLRTDDGSVRADFEISV